MRKLKLRGSNNLPESPIVSDGAQTRTQNSGLEPSLGGVSKLLPWGTWRMPECAHANSVVVPTPEGRVKIKRACKCQVLRTASGSQKVFILILVICSTRKMLLITGEGGSESLGHWLWIQRWRCQHNHRSCVEICNRNSSLALLSLDFSWSLRPSFWKQAFGIRVICFENTCCVSNLSKKKETGLTQGYYKKAVTTCVKAKFNLKNLFFV